MLNCCIKHKMNITSPQPSYHDNNSNSDDEFFEAQEMLSESSMDHVIQSVEDDKLSPVWEGREGVLHQYNDLILIATGEPLCVPITQVITTVTSIVIMYVMITLLFVDMETDIIHIIASS